MTRRRQAEALLDLNYKRCACINEVGYSAKNNKTRLLLHDDYLY